MTSMPGFRPYVKENAEEDQSPEAAENVIDQQIEQPTEQAELPQSETTQTPQQPKPLPGFRAIQPDEEAEIEEEVREEPQPLGIIESFKKGYKESASGEFEQLVFGSFPKKDQKLVREPSMWENITHFAGTLTGDFPYMMAGSVMGSMLGAAALAPSGPQGAPIGAILGSGAGSLAFPTFLKESMREYREYQEAGNDITFGDFLEIADRVGQNTLREGSMGAVLGMVQKAMPALREVPYLKGMFNTRYVGAPIRVSTELGVEAGVATSIPAISQGRLPDAKDAELALVLFGGTRLAHLPAQLPNVIKNYKSKGINLALAERIQSENLAYPPMQELRGEKPPAYKNTIELDRNISAFDESFVNNLTGKVNALSPKDLTSTHDAGTLLQTLLIEKTPEIAMQTAEVPGQKIEPIPLIRNPFMQAIEVISPVAFESDIRAGAEIREVFRENRAADKEPLDLRYNEMKEATREINFVETEMHETVNEFIDQFEGSVVPNSPEAQILNRAERILNMFVELDESGNVTGYRNVNMNSLIESNKSLKKIPNWEMIPTIRENIVQLTNAIDEVISGQLNNFNPELANEYTNLSRDYAGFKRKYDNKDTQIFFKRTHESKAIYDKFSKPDDFMQLNDSIGDTPRGQEVLNRIRRDVWQNELGNGLLTARNETAFINELNKVEVRKLNNLMEFLEPRQQADVLESVARSNQIRESVAMVENENQYKQFLNKENQSRASEVQDKQNLLVSILSQDPAKLVQNVRSIEGINRTWSALEKVEGGKEARSALARFETNDMLGFLGEKYIETGRVPYKELKVNLNRKDFRAKLEALNGKEFIKSLDNLVEISDQLSDAFVKTQLKYSNDPVTLNSAINIALALGVTTVGVGPTFAMYGAKRTVYRGLEKATNMWVDKANYDQAHISRAVEAGRALKSGNKEAIQREAMKFAPLMQKKQ